MTYLPEAAGTLGAGDGARGWRNDLDQGAFIPELSNALETTSNDYSRGASEDGTGRGTPLTVVPFDTTQITSAANYSRPKSGDPCHPLASGAHPPAVAFAQNTRDEVRLMDIAGAMSAEQGSHQTTRALQGMAVRRLTPKECERLQGFPDGYTLVPYRGKPAADGPRYRVLGNSMAVTVMAWIGRRIQMCEDVHAGLKETA